MGTKHFSVNQSDQHMCPVCNATFPEFQVAGIQRRPGARCPNCGALERHRILWLYLLNETKLTDTTPKRLLHIAPEKILTEKLREIPQIAYLSADLEPEAAMVQMDLTAINYPEASFDCILCSHVLEHIPDDRKAMSEMYRVLSPGGGSSSWSPSTKNPPTKTSALPPRKAV